MKTNSQNTDPMNHNSMKTARMKTAKQLAQDVLEKIRRTKQKRKYLARVSGQALATCLVCALLLPTAVKANPFLQPKATPIWQETPAISPEKTEALPIKPSNPFERAQIR